MSRKNRYMLSNELQVTILRRCVKTAIFHHCSCVFNCLISNLSVCSLLKEQLNNFYISTVWSRVYLEVSCSVFDCIFTLSKLKLPYEEATEPFLDGQFFQPSEVGWILLSLSVNICTVLVTSIWPFYAATWSKVKLLWYWHAHFHPICSFFNE